MKKALIFIVMMSFLLSCKMDDVNPSAVNIRLSNVSQFDFHNIMVNTSTGNVNFEDLNAGQQSSYKVFEKAYRYAFVEVEIDGESYAIQPIDYVGETPLENGNYTYQINANASQDQFGRLSLTLIEE